MISDFDLSLCKVFSLSKDFNFHINIIHPIIILLIFISDRKMDPSSSSNMSSVKSIVQDLLQTVVSSASSPSSPLSPFSKRYEEIEKMLAEVSPPPSPSSGESSNSDPVNLDDSTDLDVYEDFAVKKPIVREPFIDVNRPQFPIKYVRSYWSESRQCVIWLREGEYDDEFDENIEVLKNGNLHESFSDLASSSEFESSNEEFEETEDGPAPKRPRRSSSKSDSEKLLGDDNEEDEDDYLEN